MSGYPHYAGPSTAAGTHIGRLSELAEGYVAMAAVTTTPGTKEAFGKLAERYTKLAAERKAEEEQKKLPKAPH